jgi:hypothetical protein
MDKQVTSEEVREIVGSLEDDIISAIIATGATAAEVAEAQAWLAMDDALAKELQHGNSGRVAAVYDLLVGPMEAEEEP